MEKVIICPDCNGFGHINHSDCDEFSGSVWTEICPRCGGNGMLSIHMTNAEKLRIMSDEELAKFLAEVEYRRAFNGGGAKWYDYNGALCWLRKEAE